MNHLIYFVYVTFAIFFLIYNIVCFITKKPIYFIGYKNKKTIILNDDFFKIQLIFSAISSTLLISTSTIFVVRFYKYIPAYVSIFLFIFILINYLIKLISIKKKYIKLIYCAS